MTNYDEKWKAEMRTKYTKEQVLDQLIQALQIIERFENPLQEEETVEEEVKLDPWTRERILPFDGKKVVMWHRGPFAANRMVTGTITVTEEGFDFETSDHNIQYGGDFLGRIISIDIVSE